MESGQRRGRLHRREMNMYIIEWTREHYTRTDSGKSWKSKPYEVEVQHLSQAKYETMTSDREIRFWKGIGGCRVSRNYTPIGYVVTSMTMTSPSGSEKTYETFRFVEIDPNYSAGWRERNIARSAEWVTKYEEAGRELIKFEHEEEFCIWDETNKVWVN